VSGGFWINGVDADALTVLDRGLHYGDGLFETLAVTDGEIGLLDYHLERLRDGCQRLAMPEPPSGLREELLAAAAGQSRAVLKLLFTRGAGGRGYLPPEDPAPTRILIRYPWPDHLQDHVDAGVRVRVCSTRLGRNPRLAGVKHLNRLEQVLARSEWRRWDGIAEGLMLDEGGLVIEGTMSNVFAVHGDGRLATPALAQCGIAGVMRRHLMLQAGREDMPVWTVDLSLTELLRAQEIFVCNSIIGVWPVIGVDGQAFEIGPVTRRAQQWAMQARSGREI